MDSNEPQNLKEKNENNNIINKSISNISKLLSYSKM